MRVRGSRNRKSFHSFQSPSSSSHSSTRPSTLHSPHSIQHEPSTWAFNQITVSTTFHSTLALLPFFHPISPSLHLSYSQSSPSQIHISPITRSKRTHIYPHPHPCPFPSIPLSFILSFILFLLFYFFLFFLSFFSFLFLYSLSHFN